MPAACVLVCTITDKFISQSTSSVPRAHFRINLPETYKKKREKKHIKTIMLLFLYDAYSVIELDSVITLDRAKLDFYVLRFSLSLCVCLFFLLFFDHRAMFIFMLTIITMLISSLFSCFYFYLYSFFSHLLDSTVICLFLFLYEHIPI